jgi:hypothetical protein
MLIQLILWLAAAALYLGYAAVLGILIWRARRPGSQAWDRWAALAHALLLFLPASAFIVGQEGASPLLRFSAVLAALAVAALATFQPSWFPHRIWRRTFGHRYFAAAMALAALWGMCLALLYPPALPGAVLGGAAGLAGAASLVTAT